MSLGLKHLPSKGGGNPYCGSLQVFPNNSLQQTSLLEGREAALQALIGSPPPVLPPQTLVVSCLCQLMRGLPSVPPHGGSPGTVCNFLPCIQTGVMQTLPQHDWVW